MSALGAFGPVVEEKLSGIFEISAFDQSSPNYLNIGNKILGIVKETWFRLNHFSGIILKLFTF